MLCANTVPPSLKHLIKNYDGNYGKTCCAFWRATSFLQGPADASPAPLNIAQRPTLCLTNHDAILLKSPTAADTGKADAAIIEVLTKGHSGPTPLYKLLPESLAGKALAGATKQLVRGGMIKMVAKKGIPLLSLGFTMMMAHNMNAAG